MNKVSEIFEGKDSSLYKTFQDAAGDEFMKRFKVFHADTLFEPNWSALLQDRCCLCGIKLKFPKANVMAYCPSKKHKRFVITLARLNRIKEIDYRPASR